MSANSMLRTASSKLLVGVLLAAALVRAAAQALSTMFPLFSQMTLRPGVALLVASGLYIIYRETRKSGRIEPKLPSLSPDDTGQ